MVYSRRYGTVSCIEGPFPRSLHGVETRLMLLVSHVK